MTRACDVEPCAGTDFRLDVCMHVCKYGSKHAADNHVPVRLAGDEWVLTVVVHMVFMRTDNEAHVYVCTDSLTKITRMH